MKKSILRKITRYLIPGALFLALGLWFGVPRVTGRSALTPEAGVETVAKAAVQDGEEAGTETVAEDGEETGVEIVAETVAEDSAESAAEDITADGSETGTATGTAIVDDLAPPDCCVHVCGAVKNPGVYTLPAASRAADFVQAAGGFSEEAARDAVNLAAQPADGTQLYIPTEAEAVDILREHALRSMTGGQPAGQAADAGRSPGAGAAGTGAGGVGAGAAGGADSGGGGAQRVNLNQADSLQLQTLPGIGEKTAEKILQYREQHGGFRSTEELKNVSGIKEKSFERIRDLVTTGP